jgi:hypothetical protein
MSEIKRYNGIEEDVEGAFVYYDDYTRLQAELSAAKKQLKIACHIRADDKVKFDWAILTKSRDYREVRSELRRVTEAKEKAEKEVENLKCCGNCTYKNKKRKDYCDFHSMFMKITYCSQHTTDGLTKENRSK